MKVLRMIICATYLVLYNRYYLINDIMICFCFKLFYVDIDDCAEQKCVNGRCIDGINSYTCNCTGTGFAGELCKKGYTIITIIK